MLKTIKAQALQDEIPIMGESTLTMLIDTISSHYVKDILEIGTAVGYSSLRIASACPWVEIDTLEKDEVRYQKALENKVLLKCDQVNMILSDAKTWVADKFYDVIIIDGAKAQNQFFFDKYLPLLKPHGMMFVDNMHFHGHVEAMPQGKARRNLRQMVSKIAKFNEYVHSLDHLECELLDIDDGLLKIRRKTG